MRTIAILVVLLSCAPQTTERSSTPTATGIPFGFNGTITRAIDSSTLEVTGGSTEKNTSATTTIRSSRATIYHAPGGGGGLAPQNFTQAGFGQGAPVTVFVNRDPLPDGTYLCVEIYFSGR